MRTKIALATAILLCVPGLASAGLPGPDDVHDLVPDPQRPLGWAKLEVLTPLQDAEVGGRLLIEGTASATRGYEVRHVSIYVDNVFMGYANGTERWSYLLDTRALLDGNHTFSAYASAKPKATPFFLMIGYGKTIPFKTLNHQVGVTLFERTYDLKAAAGDAALIELKEDYTGLRVTIEGANGRNLLSGPRAQLVLAYKDADADDAPPLRTWVVTYGMLQGGAFLSRPPHGVLKAPGVLTLAGVFAGEGTVHVKVEAVRVSALG